MMFWAAGTKLARGVEVLLAGGQEDYVGAAIMMATDSLLFGVVLLIFSYAIAFGFVFQLSETNRKRRRRAQGHAGSGHTRLPNR